MLHTGLVLIHDDLAPLLVPIDNIQPHPRNYNNADLERLAESIENNGLYRPVYVQKSTGYILAGNHTWHACKSLDAEQIPVIVLDVDDHAATRILIADNRIAALARPDDALLLNLLDELGRNQELPGSGYTEDEIESFRLLQERLNNTPLGYPTIPDPLALSATCPHCGHTFALRDGTSTPPHSQ